MVKINYILSLVLILILIPMACNTKRSNNTNKDKWWTEADRNLVVKELNRTTTALNEEISNLTAAQWNFKEAPSRWSIGEIVEHLEMQNQLHYRELSVISNAPQYLEFREITKNRDDYFSSYGTDTTKGKAQWFLEPLGRFNTREAGQQAFFRARSKLTEFVKSTEIDLRKQFTFRTPVEGKRIADLKIGEVRDLHQLLLTGIGHTDRHIRQIKAIKKHPDF